jgi:hypothetical protein
MKNGQFRETGNIGYTKHRKKTNNTEGPFLIAPQFCLSSSCVLCT